MNSSSILEWSKIAVNVAGVIMAGSATAFLWRSYKSLQELDRREKDFDMKWTSSVCCSSPFMPTTRSNGNDTNCNSNNVSPSCSSDNPGGCPSSCLSSCPCDDQSK